jgi:hypothetical protein
MQSSLEQKVVSDFVQSDVCTALGFPKIDPLFVAVKILAIKDS